jgi:hypothetical protein
LKQRKVEEKKSSSIKQGIVSGPTLKSIFYLLVTQTLGPEKSSVLNAMNRTDREVRERQSSGGISKY